jgi:hypothetical protein
VNFVHLSAYVTGKHRERKSIAVSGAFEGGGKQRDIIPWCRLSLPLLPSQFLLVYLLGLHVRL